jgi:hypothetical protein
VDVTDPILHLIRTADRPPAGAVADGDWIVYRQSDRWRLDAHGDPPIPTGPVDHAQLAHLVLAAGRTLTW